MSPTGLIELLLLLNAVIALLLAGWWLRDLRNGKQSPPPGPDQAEFARRVMSRLHGLSSSIAAHMDQHSSRVREINSALSTSDRGRPEVIVTAVAELIATNEKMQDQLNQAEEKLREQAQKIVSHALEARTDALTKVANRRALDDALNECVEESRTDGRPNCVLLLDVDYFKKFNDDHGHFAGDEVLRGVARVLRGSVETRELVARYGGEEFAVVFRGSSVQEAFQRAERARRKIAQMKVDIDEVTLRITASSGLAEFLPREEPAEFMKRADEALYSAKQAGRDCGYWHDGKVARPITVDADDDSWLESVDEGAFAPAEHWMAADPTAKAHRLDQVGATGTAISGRGVFCADVERRLALWQRTGMPFAVLLARIDIPASLHESQLDGTAVVRYLEAAFRDTDHVAAYDDATYSVLLPAVDLTGALEAARRVQNGISRHPAPLAEDPEQVAVSMGIAVVRYGDQVPGLLARAEAALNEAEQVWGNGVFLHDGISCEPLTLQPPVRR